MPVESQIISFHKMGYVTTGRQKGGKLQAKTVKKLIERSSAPALPMKLLAAVLPSPGCWVAVNRMPGREILLRAVPEGWHAAS